MIPITGTFLDEISHDIPHQNWGSVEWRLDFAHMKSVGIDTVILIRSGYKKWLTYPSTFLVHEMGAHETNTDLVRLFLELSVEFDMKFYFGLYDSGYYWWEKKDYRKEMEINLEVIEEVWNTYGHYSSFAGWYLTHEISRQTMGAIELYATLGNKCKSISDGLPTILSPYIDGSKAILASQSALSKQEVISLRQHEDEWDSILSQLQGAVDIIAFQDGQVEYDRLMDFLSINLSLVKKNGMTCWSNVESFDRDMPIKFLPIKWDKLLYKLRTADKVGVDKCITFEFSHFMSPQSSYGQAKHLFNRYKEYLDEQA